MADELARLLAASPEADSSWAQPMAPPVAQTPEEQAILDEITRANLARAGYVGLAGVSGGIAGLAGALGVRRLSNPLGAGRLMAPPTAIALKAWERQNEQGARRRGLEQELEAYATRDRK